MRSLADQLPEKMKASRVATEEPSVVEASTSASTARNLMVRRRIDHIPVVEVNRPVGVLTSSHLVFNLRPAERLGSEDRVGGYTRRLAFPVRELMDADIELSHFDEPAVNLLRNMIKLGKTYSLIGIWGELQGIVTYRDFMKLLESRKQSPEIPISIVGLPQDPFESEAAKIKFSRVVSLLRRSYPKITEARCTIKSSSPGNRRGRSRYEVAVVVKTPGDLFTYSEEGWELAEIFDVLSDRLKRLVSQKRKHRAGTDLKRVSPEEYSLTE
jgi:CBS domain-containing protein